MKTMLNTLNFFSTRSVKEKIINDTMSESQLFLYFYCIMVYDALGLTLQCLSLMGKEPTLVDIINLWSYVGITGFGLLTVFIINGGAKGKNFFGKFFSFSFTVGYKYAIILIILEFLSKIIFPGMPQACEIVLYFLINIVMVVNIGFRIYQTRCQF